MTEAEDAPKATKGDPSGAERRLLSEVSTGLAEAESVDSGLAYVLTKICDSTHWEYSEVWKPSEDGTVLEHVSTCTCSSADRFSTFAETADQWTFRPGEGLPGRVWETRESELIDDVSTCSPDRYRRTAAAVRAGFGAAFAVPITTDDRVEAVLVYYLSGERPIDEGLCDIVETVGAGLGGLVARKRAEATLREERNLLERLLETSPTAIAVVSRDGRIVRSNARAAEVYGVSDAELTSRRFDDAAWRCHDVSGEPLAEDELPVAQVLDTGAPVYDFEHGIERPDGTRVWLSVNAAPLVDDGGEIERIVTATEDVTDRLERERELRAFREAFDHSGHAMYLTEPDGTIEYVNPAFESITGYAAAEAIGETPRLVKSGEHGTEFYRDLWGTILSGDVWEGQVSNRRKSGDTYTVTQTIAPVTNDRGEVERFVAVNADITEQKARERRFRRQRDTLRRVQRIVDSIRPVADVLRKATVRDDIYQPICDRMVDSEIYTTAWIADYVSAEETVEPHASAGIGGEALDRLVRDCFEGDEDGLVERAVRSREVQVVRNLTEGSAADRWREAAIEHGFRSVAAIPVVYRGTRYGVLCLFSRRPFAFDEPERGLLRELGEQMGHAISAAKNRELVYTDSVVELEFRVADETAPLVALSARLDCDVRVDDLVPRNGTLCCYVTVEDCDIDRAETLVSEAEGVDRARIVRDLPSGGAAIECILRDGSPLVTLVEQDAGIRSARISGGVARIRAQTEPAADVRSTVASLQTAFPGAELVAKQRTERPVESVDRFVETVESRLTQRQRDALTAAYHAGYYEWPRDSTAEEVAAAMDISPPTFNEHHRKGVQKVLAPLFETERTVR